MVSDNLFDMLEYAALGTEVGVRIRRKVFAGTVCKKRFYDKKYKK
mgnify:CR=1 FL=1